MENHQADNHTAKAFATAYHKLKEEIHKVIVGQDEVIDQLLIALFSKGHCVLVGVPGLAKTLLIQTIAQCFDLSFHRIQFTPDLMPADITGSETLDKERNFKFVKGPIFAHIILADEINRTPPKTQAALLEAMQERAVTIGGQRYPLPNPFFVLATQNPIEQEGTYPLPEAQLDRFMFEIQLTYPSFEEEVEVIKRTTGAYTAEVNKVLEEKELLLFQDLVRKVPVADNVIEYAVRLVQKTRPTDEKNTVAREYLEWGAGPRASQYLILGAKCHALLHGKLSPDIEDVQAVALPVLRHRIVRNFKAEAEGIGLDTIIGQLL
ncbi:AAA family ATPase [Thermonema rossianum]|uniref:AAA family ATPase n=1 Tax=Thermonema rossianum TaxID=55505 RepID=UPI00056F4422|nr:MoxR family ATPase [Thermonema rossianum]